MNSTRRGYIEDGIVEMSAPMSRGLTYYGETLFSHSVVEMSAPMSRESTQ